MLRLALAACAFDCLLWRRGSKTAAPRAAVPTRGLPAAQKRARRAENEENDVNFYNATRKAESSLQHRTGSPESRCCRDLVQAPVYFFFYCALEFNISPAHTFRPSSLAQPTPAGAKPGDGIQHHLREFDTGAAKFTCRNISTEETPHITLLRWNLPQVQVSLQIVIDPDHTPLLDTSDLLAKKNCCRCTGRPLFQF